MLCLSGAPTLVNIIGNKKALYTILLISPSIIFVSVSGVLRGCMNSFDRLTSVAISQLIEALLKLILGLSLAYYGAKLGMPLYIISALCVIGITVGSLVSCLYLYVRYRGIFKDEPKTCVYSNTSDTAVKNLLKIAIPVSIGSAVLNLGSIIDLGIIMRMLSHVGFSEEEANAIYGNYTTLAVPMFNMVISVISPIMLAFLPKLAHLYSKGQINEFSGLLNVMVLVSNSISVPCFYAFLFYSFDLLDVLFATASAAIGAELLSALSVALVLLSSLTVVNTALESMGKIGVSVLSLILGCIVKAVGNYILVMKFGILGAPISTVLSYAVSLVFSLSVLKLSGVGAKIVIRCIIDALCGMVSFSLPYLYIYSYGRFCGGLISVIVSLLFSCIMYFAILFIRLLLTEYGKKIFKMHKMLK